MNVHTTPSSNVTVTVEPRSMVTSLTDGVSSRGVFSDVLLVSDMSSRGYACINASSTTVTITMTMMRPL